MTISRRKLLDRSIHGRDARLFVIAVEGEKTEARYFEALQERGAIDRSRVHLHLLVTEDGRSAPSHVIDRLDAFVRELKLEAFDEHWLVIDRDRWQPQMLAQVAQAARQRGHRLAVSTPCFELWLLLHVTDDLTNLATCDDCGDAFRDRVGGWSKTGPMPSQIEARSVQLAIERATQLDVSKNDDWPQTLGSHVYKLMRRLSDSAPGLG